MKIHCVTETKEGKKGRKVNTKPVHFHSATMRTFCCELELEHPDCV